jgi:hypothetical protein
MRSPLFSRQLPANWRAFLRERFQNFSFRSFHPRDGICDDLGPNIGFLKKSPVSPTRDR